MKKLKINSQDKIYRTKIIGKFKTCSFPCRGGGGGGCGPKRFLGLCVCVGICTSVSVICYLLSVICYLTELIDFKVDWLGCQFLAVVLASQSEVVYICTLSALYYMAKQHRRSRAEILAWAFILQ